MTVPVVVSERRLASVLFADLVGSTSLAESRDIEDTRELLAEYYSACRSVIERYGGVVEKFIGDAVMAVWGVPVAREDDAERAVRAGLDLVAAVAAVAARLGVPELAVRVGVVTDEVAATVGAVGQGLVAGDPVNTAARVQSVAAAGEVLVDAATRVLTLAAVSYADRGEHELRGRSAPVRLFLAQQIVGSLREGRRIDGLQAPMVGRDAELGILRDALLSVISSRRPRLVLVSGEAGVGKSRLADEFSAFADGLTERIAWHRGRCLAYGEGVAMWALAEAVRSRLGLVDVAAVTEAEVGAALVEHVTDEEERNRLRPRLAMLLGDRGAGEFTPEDLFAAWARFFELLGQGRDGVVLVVEDAENADRGLLAFLDQLVTTARAPVLVVALARPELLERHAGLGGQRAQTVTLGRLPDADMARLVAALVANLPPEARDGLVARAGGVPLFALETVRALVDRDLVGAQDGTYVVPPGVRLDMAGVDTPTSLRALIAARLDALTGRERRLVSDAAVLGVAFTDEDIAVLSTDPRPAGGAPDDVRPAVSSANSAGTPTALDALVRKEILHLERNPFAGDRGQYRFVHALVREVAYGTLSRRDRRAKHLAVADHLARSDRAGELAAVTARHLFDAVDASRPSDGDATALTARAVTLTAAAGDRAAALGSFAEALDLYRSAIAHGDDPAGRAELSGKAAEAAVVVAEYDTAVGLSAAALDHYDASGDAIAAGRAAAVHGRSLYRAGQGRAATDFLRPRYDALATVEGSESARLAIGYPLVYALSFEGTIDPDLPRLVHEQLRWASQLGDDRALLKAMYLLTRVESADGSERVSEIILRDIAELAEQVEDWRMRGLVLIELGWVDMDRDPDRGLTLCLQALEVARRHGLHDVVDAVLENVAVLLWITGQRSRLTDVLVDFADSGHRHDPKTSVTLQAVDLWRVEEGMEATLGQIPTRKSGLVADEWWVRHLSMLRCHLQGETAAAIRHAEQVFAPDVRDRIDRLAYPLLLHWSARVALAGSDVGAARRLLAIANDQPASEFTPALIGQLHLLRGAIALAVGSDGGEGQDPADIEADLRAGIDAFVTYNSPPFRAQAHEQFGRWLIGQGRAEEAEEQLDAARTIYTELGATASLEQLDRLGVDTAPAAVR